MCPRCQIKFDLLKKIILSQKLSGQDIVHIFLCYLDEHLREPLSNLIFNDKSSQKAMGVKIYSFRLHQGALQILLYKFRRSGVPQHLWTNTEKSYGIWKEGYPMRPSIVFSDQKTAAFRQKSPPANHETLNSRHQKNYRFTSGTKSVKKYLTGSHIDLDIFLCIIDQLHSQSSSSRLSRGLDCHEANL